MNKNHIGKCIIDFMDEVTDTFVKSGDICRIILAVFSLVLAVVACHTV